MARDADGHPIRPTMVGMALLMAVVVFSGCAGKQATSTNGSGGAAKAKVGEPAPPFTLKDVDGKAVSLAQFKGKPVFINTFATWCPPCKQELPGIVASYPQYKDKVVYIGVDAQEDAELVKPFLGRFKIPYLVVLDPGPLTEAYEIQSLPESVFIDKAGVIRVMYRGFMTPEVLKTNLETISKS